MEATADLFPVESHPKAGLIRQVTEAVATLQELNAKHGGILTKAQVATLTGLSRQRIHELQCEGTFGRIELRASDGEVIGVFVSVPDVVEWLKSQPRPGGRPKKFPGAKFVLSVANLSD